MSNLSFNQMNWAIYTSGKCREVIGPKLAWPVIESQFPWHLSMQCFLKRRSAPMDSATFCYICFRRTVFLLSLGIWQAVSCTLYTWPATGHLVFTAPEEMKLAVAQQVTTIHCCAPELGIPGQNITSGKFPRIFPQVSGRNPLCYRPSSSKKLISQWIPDFGATLEAKISVIFQRPQRCRRQLWPNGGLLPFPFPSLIGLDVVGSHKLCHLGLSPERHEIHGKCRSNKGSQTAGCRKRYERYHLDVEVKIVQIGTSSRPTTEILTFVDLPLTQESPPP